MLTNFRDNYQILKKSLFDFKDNNPLQLASATAFFCLFALPPILIIIITLLGTFVNPEDISGNIFDQLSGVLGAEGAQQIQEIFNNFRSMAENTLTTILVAVFLIFIATNLFELVRKSINQLWSVKVKKSPELRVLLRSRLLAMTMVLIGGMVILISLLADATVTFVGDFLDSLLPDIGLSLIKFVNTIFSLSVLTLWFTLLFKILPNAEIQWRPALVGGFTTSLLFSVGKFILGKALINSNINSIFGASGSIILILLFIFYSSLIFYFGATYTKNYGDYIQQPIKPDEFSEKSLKNP
ncbi:MAG: YihY/virulence factor BrkB family protein [Balneolaceae bacterium]